MPADRRPLQGERKEPGPRLGARVRALRRREGLTQGQLADRLQVSPAYLNLIENNKRPLPSHLLIKLAQAFQIDLNAFAGDDDSTLSSDLLEVFGDPLFDTAALTPEGLRLEFGDPAEVVWHTVAGLAGYAAARRIRQQTERHEVVLVALTGWGQEEDSRRSQEAGFDAHIVKPVDLTALEKLLAGS